MTRADSIHVVAGALFDLQGRVLIAQRPPGKHMAGGWEFPGGKVSPGESAFAALKRELDEELGIEVIAATSLLAYPHDYADRRVLLELWRVLEYVGTPGARESQNLRWLAVADLPTANLLPADQPMIDALIKATA